MAAWSSTVTYALGDSASFGGAIYQSLQNGNLNHQPDISPTWWASALALVSKAVGYSVTLPQLQVSKEVGYAVTLPQLQVSKLVAYAVLLPAPQPRAWVFKASFP